MWVIFVELLLWVLLMLVSIIYSLFKFRQLLFNDLLHFGVHFASVIFLLICLGIGAFTPNSKLAVITSFAYFWINLYSTAMMIFHLPSSETFSIQKQPAKDKQAFIE